MKKYIYSFVLAICTALICTSCKTSEVEPYKFEEGKVTYSEPKFSDLAAMLDIPDNMIKAVTNDASLTGVSFTESGKVIVELTTSSGVQYVTYNYTVNDGTYVILDQNGKEVGRISGAISRATDNVSISVTLKVQVGENTYEFQTSDPVNATKLVASLAESSSEASQNVARTWKVSSINVVLEGDVEFSMLEPSGNLKVFADEAQKHGANLTDSEYQALSKTINSITLDKNGLFSIEYVDNSSETCTWKWTESAQNQLILEMRKNTSFGNKFIPVNSVITVNFTPTSMVLTLSTDITGSKNYKATVTIVLREVK